MANRKLSVRESMSSTTSTSLPVLVLARTIREAEPNIWRENLARLPLDLKRSSTLMPSFPMAFSTASVIAFASDSATGLRAISTSLSTSPLTRSWMKPSMPDPPPPIGIVIFDTASLIASGMPSTRALTQPSTSDCTRLESVWPGLAP